MSMLWTVRDSVPCSTQHGAARQAQWELLCRRWRQAELTLTAEEGGARQCTGQHETAAHPQRQRPLQHSRRQVQTCTQGVEVAQPCLQRSRIATIQQQQRQQCRHWWQQVQTCMPRTGAVPLPCTGQPTTVMRQLRQQQWQPWWQLVQTSTPEATRVQRPSTGQSMVGTQQ